ncbi:hypothetical protein [Planobispora takensis]|uniref:Uncharacterized protein n=1 Tax=Planobispora takensis TaxID=1367882 RepID=A0A8J3T4X9_9ACTN|nr:hypothetical protein [Planobispora takensis]GII05382.1 hypothetical protein Pta02_73900 [Planobispora takensis]
MSAEGVEYALRARHEERDRISDDVLDLDAHTIFRLLRSSPLRGETARRWATAEARATLLWALLDAYRGTLARADRIRADNRRLGSAELAELTGLLTGPAVRLVPDAGPLERRSLLHSGEQRFTLDEAVATMDQAFRDVIDVITDVDAVWNAALPRLDAASAAITAARGTLRELGDPDPGLEACGREIERIREELRHDPLGETDREDGEDLDRVVAEAARLGERVRRAAELRRAYGERREALTRRVGRVAAAEEEARRARDLVLAKIASPALPALADRAPVLGERLAALDPSPPARALPAPGREAAVGGIADAPQDGRWLEREELLSGLERATEDALRQAERAGTALRELIARRDELRGRLEALRAKAVRLGLAEDAGLVSLYRRAHDLLWTAPCDLRRATVAVTGYQRATEGAAG